MSNPMNIASRTDASLKFARGAFFCFCVLELRLLLLLLSLLSLLSSREKDCDFESPEKPDLLEATCAIVSAR